ncbi:hypothetical protein L0666_00835 [Octadecabacter sp. CECT 8868]|uniref:hypothetical protein n=1 Tax=Octadecabacter algicola TaxID=2909342 RepID=UPI001F2C3A7F|nr:hypothetical protein [Octadecabacter algicola]MCF2903520.1 hypothetical protein [Octadecabacter algicola]
MKHIAAFFALCAGPVFADCPDPSLDAPFFEASGPDLIAPQSWDVRATGEHVVPCGAWALNGLSDDRVKGFLPLAATARFELDTMGPHILMVMAEAECSPVLAVQDSRGVWYFGDTANGREEVTVWGASDGPLHVWIGSTEQTACEGTLTLETFDR